MAVWKSQNYKGQITNQWLPGTKDGVRCLHKRGHEETFYDDRNVLGLDFDGDYVTVYVFQYT